MPNLLQSRRSFLRTTAASSLVLAMPAVSRAGSRPVFTHGVQSGDVDMSSGMIWTRTDRPARVMMEVATTESFADARSLTAMDAIPESDMAIKRLVTGLPADQDIFYRFTAHDLSDINATSEPIVGRFRTAPTARRDIRFAWSGDTAGQGWGIDDDGMLTYATMAQARARFLHPLRRHDLCRWTDAGRGGEGRRGHLEEHHADRTRNARWRNRCRSSATSGNTT